MPENLDSYVRQRAQGLGLTLIELCRLAGISRQTLYDLAEIPAKMPSLPTILALADVLQVHPLRLLNLVFEASPSLHRTPASTARKRRLDQSAFVRDVSFPDDALVLPGQRFIKTWEVHNVGKVAWENRFLQCVDEQIVVLSRQGEELKIANALKADAQRVPVPFTKPGDTALISVNFTAPTLPDTVLSYWKSVFENGKQCFPQATGLWCKVRVSTVTVSAMHERDF
jgi:transcriptional regulator with XRE-family HTH domain